MNATTKDGLSALISEGGFEAYGRFWAFIELFHTMQINRSEFSETIRINERTLIKHLQMNQRSLPKLLELFRECLGIVLVKFNKTYGIVYKTTIPNSMEYITKRTKRKPHKEIEVDKEIEKEIDTDKDEKKKHKHGEYFHVLLTDTEKEKLVEKLTETGFNKWVKILDEGIELKGYKYKNHYLAILKWFNKEDAAESAEEKKAREIEEWIHE